MFHRLPIVLVSATILLASCDGVGTTPPPTYTVTVLANTGNLAKTSVLFNGWNTAPDAGGTIRTPGTSFPMGSADEVLYPK